MGMRKQLTSLKDTINRQQILIGVAGLLVGTLVYLIDRPPDQIYFIYSSSVKLSLHNILPNFFGAFSNNLPDFIHVFSFILLTAGIFACGKRGALFICISWFLVDVSFELGQKFNGWVLKLIPGWFAGIPYLENTKNYFLSGTFDLLDLLAIFIGTITAYGVLLKTMERRLENAENNNE
jgi:hypothetical protein